MLVFKGKSYRGGGGGGPMGGGGDKCVVRGWGGGRPMWGDSCRGGEGGHRGEGTSVWYGAPPPSREHPHYLTCLTLTLHLTPLYLMSHDA